MLLIVGVTKSVVVTVISGMKNKLNRKESSFFSLTLDKNLVLVWKVLQGVAQGDFSCPVKTLIQCSPAKITVYGIANHVHLIKISVLAGPSTRFEYIFM